MGFTSFFAELHFARGACKHTAVGLPCACLYSENYSSASVEAVY